MDGLIWTGVGISLLGLVGVIWCILRAWKLRKAGMEDARLRAELQKLVPVNLGALLLSVLGLMLVVIGIFLG